MNVWESLHFSRSVSVQYTQRIASRTAFGVFLLWHCKTMTWHAAVRTCRDKKVHWCMCLCLQLCVSKQCFFLQVVSFSASM